MITEPSQQELNTIRQTGLRPNAVGCFIHNKKILLLFNKRYRLWDLPQGGIDNGETVFKALRREMEEELGHAFASQIDIDNQESAIIHTDSITFTNKKHARRQLTLDNGKEVAMKGKHYFFVVIPYKMAQLDIHQTEFDKHIWASYSLARKKAQRMYHKNKSSLLLKVLDKLKSEDIIT